MERNLATGSLQRSDDSPYGRRTPIKPCQDNRGRGERWVFFEQTAYNDRKSRRVCPVTLVEQSLYGSRNASKNTLVAVPGGGRQI